MTLNNNTIQMNEAIQEYSHFSYEEYISKAISMYDGSIAFDKWLNRQTTTRSMMRIIEKILMGEEHIALKYLNEINKPPDIHEAGIMIGKIYAMLPISSIRELYYNFHDTFQKSDKVFERNCKKIISILEITYPKVKIAFTLKEMLESGMSIWDISNGLIIRFFQVSEPLEINRIYSRQLRKNFYKKIHSLLPDIYVSTELIASICLGFLFKLNLLKSKSERYRSKIIYLEQLERVIAAYRVFANLDPMFALAHFQNSITEFLRDEDRIVERLHWYYLAKQIYKKSFEHIEIIQIRTMLEEYSYENGIEISFDEIEFLRIRPDIKNNALGWLNKNLEEILKIDK